MKRYDILLDTNPPRAAFADGDRMEKKEDEWLIYRGDQIIARYRAERVIGIGVSEIQDKA